MSGREDILARIRTANDAAGVSGSAAEGGTGRAGGPGAPGAGYRTAGQRDQAELLDLLAGRLTDYRATVRRTTADRLTAEVEAALALRGARRIVLPAGLDVFGPAGPPAGLEVITDPGGDCAGAGGRPDTGLLDGCDGAVTGAAVAIAETGTIVLDAGPDQGRRAITLVPDYHLCIVRADQVVELVPEAVERLSAAAARPLTWISGPSATSDIELSRVEGVHGPRTLDVILVE